MFNVEDHRLKWKSLRGKLLVPVLHHQDYYTGINYLMFALLLQVHRMMMKVFMIIMEADREVNQLQGDMYPPTET